jgi:hypothetical protein
METGFFLVSGKTLLNWGVFLIPFAYSSGYSNFRNTLLCHPQLIR